MDKFRKWLSVGITALLWIVILFLAMISVGFVFGIDDDFWIMLAIGIAISIFTMTVWLPNGRDLANNKTEIKNNNTIYNQRANYIVDNRLISKVDKFCDHKNKIAREKKIRKKLYKHKLDETDLENYVTFIEQPKENEGDEKTEEESIKSSFKNRYNKLTKKQKKCLENLRTKSVTVKEITPNQILYTILKRNEDPAIHNTENAYISSKVVMKIFWAFGMALILSGTVVKFGINTESILQVFIWTFSILYNIYSGITIGYKSIAVNRFNYILDKSTVCAEFFDYVDIPLIEVHPKEIVNNKIKQAEE